MAAKTGHQRRQYDLEQPGIIKGDIQPESIDLYQKALNVRKAGGNYQDVKVACNLESVQHARHVVHAATRYYLKDSAAEYVTLENHRLDRLLFSFWGAATNGKYRGEDVTIEQSLKAADFCLKISERRAKMLGLDAAQKLDVVMAESMVNEERQLRIMSDERLLQLACELDEQMAGDGSPSEIRSYDDQQTIDLSDLPIDMRPDDILVTCAVLSTKPSPEPNEFEEPMGQAKFVRPPKAKD